MKISSNLISLVSFVFAVGCGGNVETVDPAPSGSGGSGVAGQAGSAGTAGVGGEAGSGGTTSTGGTAGAAGTAGSAGMAGAGGEAGSSGNGGTAGQAGSAGTGGVGGESGAGGQGGVGGGSGEAGSAGQAGSGGSTQSPEVSISLAANPISSVHVKKEFGVEAVGITFTVGDKPVVLKSLALTAQVAIASQNCSFGQQCALPLASNRVLAMAVYDGSTQVGLQYALDPATGKATIPNINLALDAGVTKTLVVKVPLGSGISYTEPFDKFAIGIAEQADVVFVDQDQNTVPADIQTDIQNQLGASPAIIQTIRPSGTFKIVPDAHPASTIVIAGEDIWKQFAGFKATAQYESASSDMLLAYFCTSVVNGCDADNADFTEVAVASNGVVLGTVTPPANNNWWVQDLPMFSTPLITPKEGSVHFELWGKMAPITSTGIGPASGVSRSGHAPALGLMSGYHSQEWDAAYIDKLNVRTTGVVSGERLYSEVDQNGSYTGNPMVIRKAKPVLVKQSLANIILSSGLETVLIRHQIAVNGSNVPPNGSRFALKQMAYDVRVDGCTMDLSSFRLKYGPMYVSNDRYSVVKAVDGNDLESGVTTIQIGETQRVIVSFTDEEVFDGPGNFYALASTPDFSGHGCALTIKLAQDASPSVATGHLLANDWYAPYPANPDLFNVGAPADQNGQGAWHVLGTFVWSDMSELLHSADPLTGSADWTTDYLVEDLASSQTLISN